NFYDLFWNGDMSKDIELKTNDILFLPTNELNKVYVLGAVLKPKYVAYRKGMKVLDAILDAEGFNQYASKNDVFILRHNGEKLKVKVRDLLDGKNLSQNVPLEPGDYVVVGQGLF
ncbi:MAG TPA: SLBB domain-containing protein, partial [Desulfuromonadales bacterium]|nr:SLBB domain-containing protein [Desulfuromonadales bacterium]